jgi:hypothetical protein
VFLVFFGIFITACSKGLFSTEPFVDSHLDDQNNVILEDTPRNWRDYVTYSVEPRIAEEIARETPDAGVKTWNEYWLWRIQNIPANRENREKYVDYIIDRRHQEGLPELEGYSK